jgi:uncharacterized OsmC-like protein
LLTSDATGEVEKDGQVLVIKRIHVDYILKADPAMKDKIEQVHGFHADFCPVARSIKGCIEISTSLTLVEDK